MFENLFSGDAAVMKPSAIRAISKIVAQRDVVSLAGGYPSAASFPMEEFAEVMRDLGEEKSPGVFQYGLTAGNTDLRREVVKILAGRGIVTGEEEVFLCGGAQRGLDLLGRVLLDPGDIVAVEVPTYPGAVAAFRNLQARFLGVPQDGNGMRVEALDEALSRLGEKKRRVKFIYTVPNFQNPSGATLTPANRQALIELSRREGIPIVEDDPYGDLYFFDEDKPLLRPLAADSPENVVYVSSFSKILAPGLRTAFIRAPKALVEKVELAGQASDLCSSTLDQRIVLEMCRGGRLQASIGRARGIYRANGIALLEALDEHMPEGASWNRPRGGFFLWLTLPQGIDSDELLPLALDQGVAFVPGRPFCVDGSGADALRLSFSKEPPERLRRGARALAAAIAPIAGKDH